MEVERFPSPPFPAPDSPVLGMIIEGAVAAYESGEADVRVAVTHAAVHAWYEGHIQGEDVCHGCNFRGDLPKQHWRGADNRDDFAGQHWSRKPPQPQ